MDNQADFLDGTIHLLAIAANGLRAAGLPFLAAAIDGNAEGIAAELCTAAERNPVPAAMLGTMIMIARGELDAH